MTLLFIVLACFGLAYIVGFSAISLPFRLWMAERRWLSVWLTMLECPACFGFWCGMFLKTFILNSLELQTSNPFADFFAQVFCGCFISGTNYLLAIAAKMIEPIYQPKRAPDEEDDDALEDEEESLEESY